MANEIQVNLSLQCLNGDYRTFFSPDQETWDQSAIGAVDNVQVIGTTHEAIATGDLSVPGVTVFQNLDTTNYVQVGVVVSATFYPASMIKPGEIHKTRLPTGVTLYAKANTAACKLRVLSLET